MRYGAVFFGFLQLYFIVWFSYRFWRGAVQFGAVLRFGLDSFGLDWASPNVSFNLKNLFLQLKNLANYSIQI